MKKMKDITIKPTGTFLEYFKLEPDIVGHILLECRIILMKDATRLEAALSKDGNTFLPTKATNVFLKTVTDDLKNAGVYSLDIIGLDCLRLSGESVNPIVVSMFYEVD